MFTDEQKAVIDANAAKAVAYQKETNRALVDQLVAEWTESGAMEVTPYEDIDTESFKNACTGAADWYIGQLQSVAGMSEDEAKAYVALFQ